MDAANQYDFFISHFRRLSYVKRFSTSIKVGHDTSVAEHSFYCLFLLRLIKEQVDIDVEKLSKYFFFHDLMEVFSGDIPRPFKKHSATFNKELSIAEDIVSKEVESLYGIKIVTKDSFSEEELLIISFIDMIEGLCFAKEQVFLGNRFFVEKEKIMRADLTKFIFKLQEIKLKKALEDIMTKIVLGLDSEEGRTCDILS